MKLKRPRYSVEFDENGMFSMRTTSGTEVIDRGGLHEFVDMSWWKEVLSRGSHAERDEYQSRYHYLQVWKKADSVVIEKSQVVARGVLATQSGAKGGMSYETKATLLDAGLLLDVTRTYLDTYPSVSDSSLCFLSPGGFAKRFSLCTEDHLLYMSRNDGESQRKKTDRQSGIISSVIPRRLQSVHPRRGWGCVMGASCGFGVLLLSSTPTGVGELRATRPRPPAENKFDEIEFDWEPAGHRPAGYVEQARLLVAACSSVADIQALWEVVSSEEYSWAG